jgi:hypothetical protein
LESIPGLHKSFKNTASVCFTSIQFVFFASIFPISGISRVRSASIFRICGIKRLRFASFFRICGINRLRFASICPICGINRVRSASFFRICGINRIRFASIFLRCGISRVRFASIFTSSGISRFVSLLYRKRSQDRSFVPPSFQYIVAITNLHYRGLSLLPFDVSTVYTVCRPVDEI